MRKDFRVFTLICGLAALLFVSGCALRAPQPEDPYPGKIVISEPEAGQEVTYALDGIGQIQLEFDHDVYVFSRQAGNLVMSGERGQLITLEDYFARQSEAYADFFTLWGDHILGVDFVRSVAVDDLVTGQAN